MPKMYLAMVETPLGVWENTATVCEGHEAEYRARAGAKMKFAIDAMPPFMKTGLDLLVDSYWRAAQHNGCKLIVREIEPENRS